MADDPKEPQSVADASRAMASVGFDADHLVDGTQPPAPEPIVAPTSIADRQRQQHEELTGTPAPAPAVPAVPAQTPGSPQAPPATPPLTAEQQAEQQAWEAWRANEQAQRDAFNIQRGLTTVDGVKLIVAQGLTALGKDPSLVQAFMEGRLTQQQVQQSPTVVPPAAAAAGAAALAPPVANPWDSLTEEDLVDGEQAKAWFAQIQQNAVDAARAEAQAIAAAAAAPVQNAVRQEQQVRAGQVTDNTLIELLGTGGDPTTVDKELAGKVLMEANKYIDPNNWESGHIRAAIIQGHHDVVKIAEAAQRAYLQRKDIVQQSVPQSSGGQGQGAEAAPEPQNTKEASKMARAMFGW